MPATIGSSPSLSPTCTEYLRVPGMGFVYMTARFPVAPLAVTLAMFLVASPLKAQGVPRALIELSLSTSDSVRNLNPPEMIWVREPGCPPGYELAVAGGPFGGLVTNSKGLILCVLKPPAPEASLPAPPPPGPNVCDTEYLEVYSYPDGTPLPDNVRVCQRFRDTVGTVYLEGTFDSAARTFTVFCPAGFVATGWGHSGKIFPFSGPPVPTDSVLVVASQPLPLNGWSVRLKSTSGELTLARVWAVCIRLGD